MNTHITGIHHIALKACGIESFNKTINFYHEILGLPVLRTWGEGEGTIAMLDTGAGILEIFANGTNLPAQDPMNHLAFSVQDTDACVDLVRTAGYEITVEPKDLIIPAEIPYPVRIAFCIGTVGEEVEFLQEK